MRVANIVEEARVGGPQRRIAAVAAGLELGGVETVVVGPEVNSDGFRRLLSDSGVAYIALPFHGLARSLRSLAVYGLYFFPEMWKLSKVLRRGRFDLVHVSGGSWQIKGVLAGRLARIPTVWHLNDTNQPLPVRVVFRLVSALVPTSFIVSGRRVRDYYLSRRSLAGRSVVEIRPPVDTDVFDPDRVEPESRLAKRGCPLVVVLGSVNPGKGTEMFIELAGLVAEVVPAVEFWIVGPTHDTQVKYRVRLEKLIEEKELSSRVHFFGAVSEPASALAAADIVVCTSRFESGPMVVWEAMSMAKPIVSTDVGDVRLMVEANNAGFVVPVGAAAAAAGKVAELLGDEIARRDMGRRGREVAREQLGLEKCVADHLRAYEQAAGC